jgi:CO/xanthine dehydrogenase Mo-binding subunit
LLTREKYRSVPNPRKHPAGQGIGLASHFTHGGYAAHAIEVAVSADGELRIVRCVCAADVGPPVSARSGFRRSPPRSRTPSTPRLVGACAACR